MAFFERNGYKLYYELLGDPNADETIVFFNGVMTTGASWAEYYVPFEKLGYRILIHDFKGQMKSDKPKGPYTFKEHADDTVALMEHLGIHEAHFISTSYGSAVALKIAIDNPEKVSSFVIIDGASEIDATTKLTLENWKFLAKHGTGEEFFNGVIPTIYYNDFTEANEEFLAERAKLLNNIDKDYFTGQIDLYDTFINDTNFTEDLSKITCPTLIVFGEQDILTPRKFSEILHEGIKDSEFVIIPNSGHVTIFEQIEALKSLCIGFIVKNSQSQATKLKK